MLTDCPVIAHEAAAPRTRRLVLAAPALAAAAKPGQFLHVRCGDTTTADPLLRRPLSIHDADPESGLVSLLYRVVGRGTTLLAGRKKNESVNVLGPLGRGFRVPPEYRRVVLVGGGMGVAPLFFLVRRLAAEERVVWLLHGARTAAELGCLDFTPLSAAVALRAATDDGTLGHRGSVVGLFAELAPDMRPEWVCAAGPTAMLRALQREMRRLGVPGEFSLEERMGCGIGACVCCSCRIGTPGDWQYRRVCADGPVFPAGEVLWE